MRMICFKLKAVLIIISTALFFACDNQSSSDESNYNIIEVFANGSGNEATTKLSITFDREIPDLTADDVKINSSFSLIKGILIKTDDNTYDLELIPGRTSTIRIGLDPYRGFTGWSAKTVHVTAGFYFDGTTNLTITGYGLNINQNKIIIPDNIANVPVTAVGDDAFKSRLLSDIIIPDTITSIGNSAFYNNKLTNIDDIIPDSVKKIGNNAFANNQLTSVKISAGVEIIGNDAFAGNRITYLEYFTREMERVVEVNDERIVEKFLFPVSNLKQFSGFNNNELTIIEIPISVTEIGAYAFAHNQIENITTWVNVSGAEKYRTNIITYNDGAFMYNRLKRVRLFEGTTTIGKDTFSNNQIEEIFFEGEITSIGSGAFAYNKIKKLTIPSEVATINEGTFRDNQLEEIIFSQKIKYIGNEAFRNNQLEEVNIPDNVIHIGNEAFRNNPLIKITIGENVTLGIASFGDGFEKAYDNNKKAAGIYTRTINSTEWTFEEEDIDDNEEPGNSEEDDEIDPKP